jgi:hypothetical protein
MQEFTEMQKTAFKNVVVHPSVPDDLVPAARFVWDADLKEMVFDGFENFNRGRRNAEK